MTAGLLATQPPRASVGLLRHADFLRLWTGQTVSRFGSQVSLLAIAFAGARSSSWRTPAVPWRWHRSRSRRPSVSCR